ncbi:MAG: DUF4292 domain-containing protein [Candidatus Desulfaltia sp.]|nr:DUF4292 domain-containing protein [Candidatus Desulfaltia sp.]
MRYTIIILFAAVFLLSACAGISGVASKKASVSEDLHEAANLLLSLKNKNNGLKTFKGAGKVTFWGKGKKGLISNIAWVGSEPDKIRFAMRSLSGQPVVTLACDGTWLYFLSHMDEQRFYKKPSKNSTLKQFISIPIKSSDIVSILAGQIPVAEHDSAIIKKNRSKDGYVIILKKDWENVIEMIYLDETRTTVRKIEMFDLSGLLLYRAEFAGMQNINGYLVPSRLFFSGANGDSFHLDINRYWADVSILPSVFVLTPQKGIGD